MPQNKFAIARYRIINELLNKHEYVKSSAIADTCRYKIGFSISLRTIQKDIESMRHDPLLGLFAPIEYCSRRKAYYYSDHISTASYFLYFSQEEIATLQKIIMTFGNSVTSEDRLYMESILKKIKSSTY